MLWRHDNGTPAVWHFDGLSPIAFGLALPSPGRNGMSSEYCAAATLPVALDQLSRAPRVLNSLAHFYEFLLGSFAGCQVPIENVLAIPSNDSRLCQQFLIEAFDIGNAMGRARKIGVMRD